jgi:hypothetical protein
MNSPEAPTPPPTQGGDGGLIIYNVINDNKEIGRIVVTEERIQFFVGPDSREDPPIMEATLKQLFVSTVAAMAAAGLDIGESTSQ